jgi:hypothetical protein
MSAMRLPVRVLLLEFEINYKGHQNKVWQKNRTRVALEIVHNTPEVMN